MRETGKISLKNIMIAAAAIFVLFTALNIFSYQRWMEDQYFGEVIEINADWLKIRTKSEGDIKVRVDNQTIIKKGRSETKEEEMNLGDQVIVVGMPAGEGAIMARVIRVVKPSKSQVEPI